MSLNYFPSILRLIPYRRSLLLFIKADQLRLRPVMAIFRGPQPSPRLSRMRNPAPPKFHPLDFCHNFWIPQAQTPCHFWLTDAIPANQSKFGFFFSASPQEDALDASNLVQDGFQSRQDREQIGRHRLKDCFNQDQLARQVQGTKSPMREFLFHPVKDFKPGHPLQFARAQRDPKVFRGKGTL